MKTKEIKIDIPEGYEIDKDNSTFEKIVFKPIKKKLPTTWEEFCENYPIQQGSAFIGEGSNIDVIPAVCDLDYRDLDIDKNILPSKEMAKAFLALMQLIQLRDCYNDGWVSDWTDGTTKYSIFVFNNKPDRCSSIQAQRVLTFKTLELRNEFFDNFKDLIKIAKPLL